MKVRNKLVFSFSLIIVLLGFIIFYVGFNFKNLREQFDVVNDGIIPDTNLLIEVENIAGDAYLETMDYVVNNNEDAKQSALSLLIHLEVLELTQQPQHNYVNKDEYIDALDLVTAINQFRSATSTMISIKESTEPPGNLFDFERNTSLATLRQLQDIISNQKAIYSGELVAARLDFNRAYKSGLQSMLLAAGIITVAALLAGYLTTRSILKPLYALRKGTEMIAQGNLAYKVGTKAKDEIGQLSRAFDRMTHSLSSTMTSVTNLHKEITERKQAEKNLEEEKDRANKYLNIAGTMLLALDLNGKVTMINKKGCEILEYEEEEILGKDWIENFMPASLKAEARKAYEAIISGKITPFEKVEGQTVLTKSGREPYVVWYNSVIKDEYGRITGTLSSGEDVTVHKESEERFRLLADNSTDLISLVRVTPNITTEYISPACLRITGYSQEEFYSNPGLGLEMVHPDDRKLFTKHVSSENTSIDIPVYFRVVRKDGRIIRMEQTHKTILNDNGDTVAMHLIAHDVTERVENEEKYRSVVENINSGIIVIQDGKTVFYNPLVYTMLGYTEEEFAELDFISMVHPEDVAVVTERIKERLNGLPATESILIRGLAKSGDIRWIETRSVKIEWNNRPAVQAFILDITERQKAEEALRESEEKFSKSFRTSPTAIAITTLKDGEYIEVNDSYTRATGYTHEELIGNTAQAIGIWVNEEDRTKMFDILESQGNIRNEEFEFRMKSGEIRTWLFSAEKINFGAKECMIAVCADITMRKKREQMQDAENHVLTLLGQGAELSELLESIVVMGEFHNPSIKGSILLLDTSREQLIPAAAPSLPADYGKVISKWITISPDAGISGTVAYRRERVVVPDTIKSPLFSNEEFLKLAIANGLLACWSQPIMSSDGELLGTIANYCDKIGEPTEADLAVLEWSARIAAIAIERKRSIDALIESREFSSSLLENSPTQVVVINPDTSIRYANPSWEELNGWTLAEVQGTKIPYPWWPKDMTEVLMEAFMETLNSGNSGRGEINALKKNGEMYWMDMKWCPIMRNGKLDVLLVTSMDITEKKQAEDALRESEERLRDLFDNASELIQSVDMDGHFIYVNKACVEALGYKQEEIENLTIWDIIHPDHLKKAKAGYRKLISGGSDSNIETVFISKTSVPIQVEGGATVQLKDGNVVAIRSIFRDITQRKHMEGELKAYRDHLEELVRERTSEFMVVNNQLNDELAERKNIEKALRQAKDTADVANKAKSEFLARMSHEIRTPIHGIMGTLDLVMSSRLEREQRQYLDMAKSSADSLLNVINDILDFSKIEAGKMEIENIDFNLPATVDETCETMAVSAFRKGLELTCHLANDVPRALIGDSARLRQILINLVGNSIKFTGHGEIAVSATLERETKKEVIIHFMVRDTGIGILPESQNMIFENFQQADGSVSRQYGGTGLGLTICRQLVSQMGGRIWLESTSGQGSTFHFTVKFAKQSQRKQKALLPVDMPELKDLPLLLVDDNMASRLILAEVLDNWGFRVTAVDNGPAAIQELSRTRNTSESFRLILLDKNMPTIDGFAVAEKILQESAHSHDIIMMLPPDNVSNDLSRCQELGISVHVVKPMRRPVLREAVLKVLGLSPPEQEEVIQVIPSDAGRMHLRILIAEDNPTSQLIARKTLEKMGHTVEIAGNGLEEVRLFEEGDYDLVLTDVEMPIMDGFEATRRIKRIQKDKGQNIPIIAMTAYAQKEDREKCLASGMDSYLSKPVKADDLHAILNELFKQEESSADIPVVESNSVSETIDIDAVIPVVEPNNGNKAVDMAAAMEVFGDDMELLKEASGLFVDEDYPEQIKLLRDGIEQQDPAVVKAAAHSIKGAARSLGGMGLGEAAFRLEQMGRDGDLTGVEEQIEEMGKEFKLLADFFMAMSP